MSGKKLSCRSAASIVSGSIRARAFEPSGRLNGPPVYSSRGKRSLVNPPKEEQPWCALVIREAAGHLWQGCIGSAVVAVLRPLIVAAYACDLDGVVLLQFPDSLVEEYNLEAGSRLLCVNIFSRTPPAVPIEHGPASSGSWADFHPLIAEFFSDDRQRVLERKAEVDEPMWQRASECAAAAVRRRMPVRDGRYSTPLLQPPYFSPTP
jgi:hypothetical protein